MNRYRKELQKLVKFNNEHIDTFESYQLSSEIHAEFEKLFVEECYVCERTRKELEDDNGLSRTLVTDTDGYLSFCDEHYNEDGSFNCADCGIVFKWWKPDLRKPRNKLLWAIYGTGTTIKTVNVAKGSNIYCTNCVDR